MGSDVVDAPLGGWETRSPREVKRELQRRRRAQSGYDVFISYARETDAELAQTLERGLERWARPWYGGRGMRVFRYVSKMSASSDLAGDLRTALLESRWLLVVLSERAANDSPWVDKEIRDWRSTSRDDRILLVVADGRLRWDPTTNDFSADSTCIPPALRGAFRQEPRYVDFRERKSMSGREWRRARHTAIRDLATKIHAIPADVLEGAHRSTVRATRIGLTAIAVLLVLAATGALLAVRSGREADQQQEIAARESAIARADALAAAALDAYDDDVGAGLLQAVEALRFRETPETRAAVMAGLVQHRHLEQVIRVPETPYRIAVSPDENRLAVFSLDQHLRIFDLEERIDLADEFLSGAFVESIVFDDTGEHVALLLDDDSIEVRSVADLATVSASSPGETVVHDIAFADGHVYVGHADGVDQIDAESGTRSRVVDGGVSSIATDASARHLALTRDNVVQVWDISVQPPDGIEEVVRTADLDHVGISPVGDVVSFTEDDMVARWDRPTVTVLSSVQTIPDVVATQPAEALGEVSAVQSGGRVAFWAPWLADLIEIDVGSGGYETPPAIGARGRRIAAVGESEVTIWRSDQPYTISTSLSGEGGVPFDPAMQVDITPDGDLVLVLEPGRLTVLDVGRQAIRSTTVEGVPCTARFADSGDRIVAIAFDGATYSLEERSVDDPGTALDSAPIELDACPAGEVDVSRDGEVVAVGTTVMSTATGVELASTGRSAIDTALSADGTVLWWTSSGGEPGAEHVGALDVTTGQLTEYPVGQSTWGVAHGPDGTTAAGTSTARDEGAVLLWDGGFNRIATLPRVHLGTKEPAGEDPVMELAMSRDGERLVTAGYLGTVTLWETGSEASIAAACEVANRGLTPTEADDVEAALGVSPSDPCASTRRTSSSGRVGPLVWDADAPTSDFDIDADAGQLPGTEPTASNGFVWVTDETQMLSVELPEQWTESDTSARPPIGSGGEAVPTIVAAPSLADHESTVSTSGTTVQLLPHSTTRLGDLLLTVSANDRQACVVAGDLDLGETADLLLRCESAGAHIAYAAEVHDDAHVVIMRFVLASSDDPPLMEAIKDSVVVST